MLGFEKAKRGYSPGISYGSMPEDTNIADSVKKHPVVFYLSALLAGFVGGYGVHAAIFQAPLFGTSSAPSADWQALATTKGWISKADCPAMPLSIRITAPGDGTTTEAHGLSEKFIELELVVDASYPVPKSMAVGFIDNVEGDPNFQVAFPSWDLDDERKVFRASTTYIETKGIGAAAKKVDLWGFVVPNESQVGKVYGSLDQIKAVSPSVVFSPKVTIMATSN